MKVFPRGGLEFCLVEFCLGEPEFCFVKFSFGEPEFGFVEFCLGEPEFCPNLKLDDVYFGRGALHQRAET